MTITSFPLAWPPGWKRTPDSSRALGQFGTAKRQGDNRWSSKEKITIAEASNRVRAELGRMGVRDDDLVLSTNLKLRLDGLPRSDQRAPDDPGAAIYWTDPWSAQPRCMAIDRYTKVEQNIAALAATIEAMRAIEHHGGAVVLERAFTGFTALPAPIVAGMVRPWWEVLGVPRDASPVVIAAAYRAKASAAHPDKGGSTAAMADINVARAAASAAGLL